MKTHTDRLAQRTLTGLVWVVSGALAQTLIKLVVFAVLARVLTPAEFGFIALSMMFGTFVLMVCRVGVGPALVQLSELTPAHVTAAITLAIPVAAAASCGLVLAAPSLAAFFEEPKLEPLLYVNAFVPLMLGLSQVSESLLQRDLRFKTLTLLDGVSFVLGYGAVSISLALMDFGAISVIWGLVAQEAIRTVLLFTFRFVRPGISFGLAEVRGLLRFGLGISLVQATNTAAYQLDNLVVSKMLGTQALGLYSRAYQVITVPTKLIGNTATKALFPAMSLIQNDRERFSMGFTRALGGTTMIALPVSTFLFIFAPEIIFLMLGDQWSGAVAPFRILSIAILFRVGHKVCEAAIRANGAVYHLLLRQLVFAISVLVFAYIGHGYGIAGVAIGVLLASFVNILLLLDLTKRIIDIPFRPILRTLMRQMALGLPFAAILWGTAELLRAIHDGPLAVLLGGFLATVVILGLPLWRSPQMFGAEGVFVSEMIGKYLRRRKGAGMPEKSTEN